MTSMRRVCKFFFKKHYIDIFCAVALLLFFVIIYKTSNGYRCGVRLSDKYSVSYSSLWSGDEGLYDTHVKEVRKIKGVFGVHQYSKGGEDLEVVFEPLGSWAPPFEYRILNYGLEIVNISRCGNCSVTRYRKISNSSKLIVVQYPIGELNDCLKFIEH